MPLVNSKINLKLLFLTLCLFSTLLVCGQTIDPNALKPDPEKEAKFLPYLAVRHGGFPAVYEWKKSNTVQYYKELWYYCQSFYVKRDYLKEGVSLDESGIDISRFEQHRLQNEEAIVELGGYKDVVVLLPISKLVYKP